jgi:hypothetical protein
MTPLGLLRQTTLPQGATNSVAQFVRIVVKILADLIPTVCQPFVDDLGVKGPSDIERSGATFSGEKSQFCMEGIKIVGFVCDARGRSPETAKIAKVVDWEPCHDLAGARAFIGLCVYYRTRHSWIRESSSSYPFASV